MQQRFGMILAVFVNTVGVYMLFRLPYTLNPNP